MDILKWVEGCRVDSGYLNKASQLLLRTHGVSCPTCLCLVLPLLPPFCYSQSTIATGFDYPVSIAVDCAGNVFIADQEATDILEERLVDGYTQTVAFPYVGNVEAVAVDGAGDVFIGSLAYGLLKETPGSAGYAQSTISRTRYASAIAADSSGNLYVGQSGDALYKEIPRATKLSPRWARHVDRE